jgi:hypothetical protein
MRVTLIQTEIDGSLPLAERVAGVAEQIAACTGDLVLLPELWATGYFAFDDYAGTAQPLDGPLVRAMGAAAAAAGVVLHAGSMVERDAAGRLFNTSLLFDRDGALVHTYRKVHLFGYGSREQELLTPGSTSARTASSPCPPATTSASRSCSAPRSTTGRSCSSSPRPGRWPGSNTGSCCFGRGRWRTRASCWRATPPAGRARSSWPAAARWSTRGAPC